MVKVDKNSSETKNPILNKNESKNSNQAEINLKIEIKKVFEQIKTYIEQSIMRLSTIDIKTFNLKHQNRDDKLYNLFKLSLNKRRLIIKDIIIGEIEKGNFDYFNRDNLSEYGFKNDKKICNYLKIKDGEDIFKSFCENCNTSNEANFNEQFESILKSIDIDRYEGMLNMINFMNVNKCKTLALKYIINKKLVKRKTKPIDVFYEVTKLNLDDSVKVPALNLIFKNYSTYSPRKETLSNYYHNAIKFEKERINKYFFENMNDNKLSFIKSKVFLEFIENLPEATNIWLNVINNSNLTVKEKNRLCISISEKYSIDSDINLKISDFIYANFKSEMQNISNDSKINSIDDLSIDFINNNKLFQSFVTSKTKRDSWDKIKLRSLLQTISNSNLSESNKKELFNKIYNQCSEIQHLKNEFASRVAENFDEFCTMTGKEVGLFAVRQYLTSSAYTSLSPKDQENQLCCINEKMNHTSRLWLSVNQKLDDNERQFFNKRFNLIDFATELNAFKLEGCSDVLKFLKEEINPEEFQRIFPTNGLQVYNYLKKYPSLADGYIKSGLEMSKLFKMEASELI